MYTFRELLAYEFAAPSFLCNLQATILSASLLLGVALSVLSLFFGGSMRIVATVIPSFARFDFHKFWSLRGQVLEDCRCSLYRCVVPSHVYFYIVTLLYTFYC